MTYGANKKPGREPSFAEVLRSIVTMASKPIVERPVTEHQVTTAPKFADLKFEPHRAGMGGVGCKLVFPNGYGASIIKTSFSYGGSSGLYEIAVLNRHGGLCYTTPVTNDVLGYLTVSDVEEVLAKIAALPEQVQP